MTTALIVDDSRLSRMMILSILKETRPDWKTIEATNGEEALQKAVDVDINVMILDYNMPGMDGITLGIELKNRYPNAFITLLTANIQDKIRMKAEESGLNFRKKPVTQDTISAIAEQSGQ